MFLWEEMKTKETRSIIYIYKIFKNARSTKRSHRGNLEENQTPESSERDAFFVYSSKPRLAMRVFYVQNLFLQYTASASGGLPGQNYKPSGAQLKRKALHCYGEI